MQETELQMLVRSQADLQRELGQERARAERAVADSAKASAALADARAQLAAARADQQAATEAAAKAGAEARASAAAQGKLEERVAVLEAELAAAQAAVHTQAAAAAARAVQGAGAAVKSLRNKYFTAAAPVLGGGGGGGAGAGGSGGPSSSSAQDGLQRQQQQQHQRPASASGSYADRAAVVAEVDESVGLRLCELSHEQVMQALEDYMHRQAMFGRALAVEAAVGPIESDGGSSQGAGAASASAVLGAASMRPVETELLWLEGCLLVALVELRQQGRQIEELREGPSAQAQAHGSHREGHNAGTAGAVGGGAGSGGARAGGAGGSSAMAKQLVGQMMQAMAKEKRLLQRKVSSLEASQVGFVWGFPLCRRVLHMHLVEGAFQHVWGVLMVP